MKILVTGGAGFVGTNLIKRLLKEGHEIHSVDNYTTGLESNHQKGCKYWNFDIRNITDYNFINPDVVFHLAAIARIQPSFERPKDYFEVNANGTMNLAWWCAKNNVPLIYAGSSSKHSGKLKNPYTFSKDIGEEIIMLYQYHYNLQATIDWLLWFVKWLGPQGQALAKIVETIQAVAYMFASLFKETTKERVSLFIEGLSKFLSLANFNIKVPGLSNWIDKITSFLDKYGFSSVIAKLISQGKNINDRFDRQPKWIQAVVTLIVQAVGTAVSTIFTWINTNLLTPFYNLIISYNTTVGGYLKTIIDYLAIFASMIDTAKIIIDDPDTKGILNLGK
jgi:hypothetical protein